MKDTVATQANAHIVDIGNDNNNDKMTMMIVAMMITMTTTMMIMAMKMLSADEGVYNDDDRTPILEKSL